MLSALITHSAFLLLILNLFLPGIVSVRRPFSILMVVFQSAGCLLFLALIFVPLCVLVLNVMQRRASYRLVIQQEYVATTSALFYAWGGSALIAALLTVIGTYTGVVQKFGYDVYQSFLQQRGQMPAETVARVEFLLTPLAFSAVLPLLVMITIFAVLAVVALQIVFRTSWLRAAFCVMVAALFLFPAFLVLQPIFSVILGSPFLLFLLFFLFRGYFADVSRNQRARESFRQNLEAATLNPADASAHYNLGLIHQQRGELDAARERFERAVQIDAEEVDAHYQLGRIALEQKRYADAIRHFEQVVGREPTHAQHEVWREVGATYLAAEQFEDARDALEKFLEKRPSDPEALYLMGRSHAGLGHRREAANLMQACIEAVRSAPAYKYRADKRWLNEAQQFIKSSSQ